MEYFISKVPKGFINLYYLLCMALLLFTFKPTEAIIGVSYGASGNNLPSPQQVVNLYNAHGIKYMRIYSPDRTTLEALQGSGIHLVLDVPNDHIQTLAQTPSAANDWIQQNIVPYASFIRYIVVGNEVEQWIRQYVGPALWNIQNALNAYSNCRGIKVTTAIGMSLIKNAYPPSAGEFNDLSFMDPIIYFLEHNGSPLLVNIYPYFSYIGNKQYISLDYALFTSPGTVITDSNNGLQYQNLFDAMVDAVYAALSKRGASNSRTWVIAGETGWPSAGGASAKWHHGRNQNVIGGETGWPSTGGDTMVDSVDTALSKREAFNSRTPVVRAETGWPSRGDTPVVRGDQTGHPSTGDTPRVIRGETGWPSTGDTPRVIRGETGWPSPGDESESWHHGMHQNVPSKGGDAMVDSVYAASSKRGASNTWRGLSKKRWPSAPEAESESLGHGRTYYQRMIEHSKYGTPLRPGEMEIYLFSMFDENNKGGAETEKNFGLFYPNGKPKYDLSFTS